VFYVQILQKEPRRRYLIFYGYPVQLQRFSILVGALGWIHLMF